MPAKGTKGSMDYQLVRMRLFALGTTNPASFATQLQGELRDGYTSSPDVTRYGLAIASYRSRDYKTAEKELTTLLKKYPDNLYMIMAMARLESAQGKHAQALKRIDQSLKLYPNNYPLLYTKAGLQTNSKDFKGASTTLHGLSRSRPKDPDIWFELAEAQGQAKDILGLHQSRAEFFFLTGNLDDAIRHLQQAKKMAGDNYALSARIDKKLSDIYAYRRKIKN